MGSVLIQLRIQIVEEGDGVPTRLLPIDLEIGEDEGQKKASGLARRGFEGRVTAVQEQLDRVTVRSREAPPDGSLASLQGLDLACELPPRVCLTCRSRWPCQHLILLPCRCETTLEHGAEPSSVLGPPKTQPRTQLQESLCPHGKLASAFLQGRISLPEDPLKGPDIGSVCRP
jgi:hypothetical protein